MRRAADLPFSTPVAAVLAVGVAAAWIRLGPLVPLLVAVPVVGVVLLALRWDATAMLLPLCLLPFAVRAGGMFVGVTDVMVLGLACCLAVAAAAGLEPPRPANPLLLPAVAFVAWTLASAAWAASPAKALQEATQRLEFAVIGVALVAALPVDGRHAHRALAGLAAGAAALGVTTVVLGVAQHRYVGVYPLGIHKNAAGSLISYGLVAALGLRLAAPGRRAGRWLAAAGLATLAGLVVTGSRGAWIGTLLALATVVAMRRPGLVWPVASVTVVVTALFLLVLPPETLGQEAGVHDRYSTAAVRAETWHQGVEAIGAHPLLGVGAGNFVAHLAGRVLQVDPNNLFLLTWAETGLPGLALLLWFLAGCLRLAWRNARTVAPPQVAVAANAAGVAMLVDAVVHAQFDVFWVRGTALAAFLGAGLVVWAGRAIAAPGQPREPVPTPSAIAWSRCP
ncbi:MAG TPA: O-antigen ligase family protein [Actinomycetota bacterium]